MIGAKTRCKQCVYTGKTAVEMPCAKCGEVQFTKNKHDNHFLDVSENKILGVNNNG